MILTFWDKVRDELRANVLQELRQALQVPVFGVDARHLTEEERQLILLAMKQQAVFKTDSLPFRVGWKIEPKLGLLDLPYLGPALAVALLFVPAMLAVWIANTIAFWVDPAIRNWMEPLVRSTRALPEIWKELLAGRYGFLTLFPLMFVWAVPTQIFYTFLLATYQASGLGERITATLHPFVWTIGLTGRDLLRVMMGFGCNVPAVINSRACSA